MVNLINVYRNLRSEGVQFGHGRALTNLGHRIVNKVVSIRRFEMIALWRENLLPIDLTKYSNISSRLATEEDLNKISSDEKWQISKELREAFSDGDSCLLSFVDGKLAGYTWIHTAGRPRLIAGLRISVPENCGYNYAGFTLPEYRGIGLQSYRHHEILNRSEWSEKIGMIGYVDTTNWSSKKGQAKSGYRKLGDLMIVGTGNRMKVSFSKKLKNIGIGRLVD